MQKINISADRRRTVRISVEIRKPSYLEYIQY